VLRKILRRAIRHGKILGAQEPFIYTLAALVAELMKDAYPELLATREYAAKIVRNEEEKFSATLIHGTQLLDEICDSTSAQEPLSGKDLFRLYDTYGFPFDLAREIAAERGLSVDEKGFYAEMEKQRTRARASWKGGEKEIRPIYQELVRQELETEFTGYTRFRDVSGRILAIVKGEKRVSELAQGETGEIILDQTPFYAESGGQVADRGTLSTDTAQALVQDVYSPISGLRLHKVQIPEGRLRENDTVLANISLIDRAHTNRNHTATHLMHAALREVLGEHVKQAGSLVDPERLRFDFTHYKGVSRQEIRRIEELVNEKIRQNIQVETDIRDLDEAIQEGAMALFGEKYRQQVRVVKVPGFSMELCGGTHVTHTGSIALFKIVHEGSVSAGVRRVEALTGEPALVRFLDDETLIRRVSEEFKVQRTDLIATLDKMSQELKETTKQVEQLQWKLAQKESADVLEEVREIQGVRVLSRKFENLDRNRLRQLADELKNRLETGVVVLGTPIDGRVSLVAMVTPDLTDRISANDLIQRIAPLVGGGGGGKPDMAEAGGKDPAGLGEALEQTYRVVEELLN
jgi:alanyl-tRNA synthetase